MRYKVIAAGILLNGEPLLVGMEVTIVDRFPEDWLKCLKEIPAKKVVEPTPEPEPEKEPEPDVNTIVVPAPAPVPEIVPEPEKKADKK